MPRQQLLGQWRECCLIAKQIAEQGKPNHLLVNKIMDYPIEHFYSYAKWVKCEMKRRGYKCDFHKFTKWYRQTSSNCIWYQKQTLFPDWHTERYLKQCFYNLQEKYDCGGITDDEWQSIYEKIMLLGFQEGD